MPFGFTNDDAQIAAVRAWVAAAVADGWTIEPTYPCESVERAARLRRDGWLAQVVMRDMRTETKPGKWKYEAQVHVWGPDGLCVDPGAVYSWADLVAGLRVCDQCGGRDVDTKRVGFANRVCAVCVPAARKRIERPGWCD